MTDRRGGTATYLYCLVQDARRPSLARAPRGLPDTGPLRLVEPARGLWLIAASAPLARYGSEPIERGLRDLEWVAACGAAHERVVEHFARRRTTVPMKLFTLFTSDERALAYVRSIEPAVRKVLGRVAGRQEWGVRVRLDPTRFRRQARARAGARDKSVSAGTRFLEHKKHERDAAQALLREGRAEVEAVFESLAALAAGARRRPPAELDGTRLVLDAAFLVPVTRAAGFRQAARRTATRLAERGYTLSLTGPWPPYNFVNEAR